MTTVLIVLLAVLSLWAGAATAILVALYLAASRARPRCSCTEATALLAVRGESE